MSAIVAAAAARGLSERTRQWVLDATAYSAVAGPDDQAVAFGPRWGLGHALLRTGRDGVEQPLTRDGRVWLVADVRLDARSELISRLRGQGHPADRGSTDPELLLAAYHAWGDAFLEGIAGDFAFALWDEDRGRLLCGRDQIGVVPLHYARVQGELLIATALDALLMHPEVSDELDEVAIAAFLVMGRGDFVATTFQAIRRLPPAHTIALVDTDLRLRAYWHQEEWPPLLRFKTSDEYVNRFRELLETSVADRITDDRVSVQISGGMDCPSVAAFAHRVTTERQLPASAIRGMTMVLGAGTGDEEGKYAELVARFLGIKTEIEDESRSEPLDPFAHVSPPMPLPEPIPYRWTTMEYLSLLRSTSHSPVMLTGLPGDGLLKFVPWYWIEWLARGHPWRLLQAFVDNARLFDARPHPHLRRSAEVVLRESRRRALETPRWLASDFATRTAAEELMRQAAPVRASRTDVRSISRDPGWSDLFIWSSPSFSHIPLVVRHPLGDLRLLAFVAGLPPEPWLMRKRILREATRGLLPEAVLARPKTLLARARRPSITPSVLDRLGELVRTAPDAARFFEVDALLETIMSPNAAVDHPHDHLLLRALGLVHWRAHWRRPDASAEGTKGIGVVSNLVEEGNDGRFAGTTRVTST